MRILIFDNGHHAIKGSQEAFQALDHETFCLQVEKTGYFDDLAEVLSGFRPDLVFAVNHAGFDNDGLIAQRLADHRICQAIWYIDSPYYVPGAALEKQANPFAAVFSWERAYLEDFKSAGYPAAIHLPLATDPKRFSAKARPQQYPLSFVGSTWRQQQAKWGFPPDRLQHLFFKNPPQRGKLREWGASQGISLSQSQIAQFEIWATVLERQNFATALAPLNTVFFGDSGWGEWLMSPAQYLGDTRYREEMADIYRSSKISLNLTPWHMPTSVNQRVFDVPACGGFLLTDDQADLDLLFAPGEICRYRSLEEAQELARHYTVHEAERLAMARAAHQRVLLEHTYLERINRLLAIFN